MSSNVARLAAQFGGSSSSSRRESVKPANGFKFPLLNELNKLASELAPTLQVIEQLEEMKGDQAALTAFFAQLDLSALGKQVPANLNPQQQTLTELFPAWGASLSPEPAEQIKACVEASEFYLNRVQKAAKEADDSKWLNWCDLVKQLYAHLKNASLPKTKVVTAVASTSTPHPQASVESPTVTKQGNRWVVSGQGKAGYNAKSQPARLTVEVESLREAVQVEDVWGAILEVKGKLTAISFTNCAHVGLLVTEPVVSQVEAVSCHHLQLSLQAACPTLLLDDCEAIQVQLESADSRSVAILTSKCAEINVLFDEQEQAIPVQFKTTLTAQGQLTTEPVQHAGA